MAALFHNGRFFQSGPAGENHYFAECLLADAEGIITHVGSLTDEPVQNTIHEAGDSLKRHNMNGRIVLPGFIDGHMHLLMFGQSLQKCELGRCENLDDIRSTIAAFAKQHPEAPRIMCKGWMRHMSNGLALASMIDDLDPRPIFIDSKDLHSTWCNTAALDELQIHDMPNPEGGEIERDEQGKATGQLNETAAVTIVWPHIAKVAPMHEKVAAIKGAIRAYHETGYTGLIEMATDENIWEAIQAVKADPEFAGGELPIRFILHWLIKPSKTPEENIAQVNRAIELHQTHNAATSPDCRIAGIKIICDGIVDACTASLTEPYSSNAANPDAMWSPEELAPVVRAASSAGLQCALHAIGDRTIRNAIDALEHHTTTTSSSSSNNNNNNNLRDQRHRIEHLELASPEDATRLGKLGITASIQAVHADPAILQAWPKLLGPERTKRAFAYTDFSDAGATLALGSDSPSAPHHVLPNLYIATTRRSARRPGVEGVDVPVNPEFALGLSAAVAAGTRGSAYSCFGEGDSGSLDKGKRVDLAVVDMVWEAGELLRGKVVGTWVKGKQVFDGEGK